MQFYRYWSIVKRLIVCAGVFAALAGLALALLAGGPAARPYAWALPPLFFANGAFFYFAIVLPLAELRRRYVAFNRGYERNALFDRPCAFTEEERAAQEKLRVLLDDREVTRLTHRQAQYLALQNQINPHFLYNTLESIRGDALCAGMDEIAEVTEALATFFRYTISHLDNLVSLEDELHNAENYFAIQNYRFGERIALTIRIAPGSEAARECRVPRLILQPIIENAVIHGLEARVGPGRVSIDVRLDAHRLTLGIDDDGLGIPEAALARIRSRLDASPTDAHEEKETADGGIALVNIDHRIKLLFGERFGLSLFSLPGHGTRVEILLPATPPEAGDKAWLEQEA